MFPLRIEQQLDVSEPLAISGRVVAEGNVNCGEGFNSTDNEGVSGRSYERR